MDKKEFWRLAFMQSLTNLSAHEAMLRANNATDIYENKFGFKVSQTDEDLFDIIEVQAERITTLLAENERLTKIFEQMVGCEQSPRKEG